MNDAFSLLVQLALIVCFCFLFYLIGVMMEKVMAENRRLRSEQYFVFPADKPLFFTIEKEEGEEE